MTYTEVWKNAFSDVFSGKKGYLYCCEADEKSFLRFPSHRSLRLSVSPVPVARREEIDDLYTWFRQREQEGKFLVQKFESLTQEQLTLWYRVALETLSGDSPAGKETEFSRFVREKMPVVWERFLFEQG